MSTPSKENQLITTLRGVEAPMGKFVAEKLPALAPATRESLARFIPWVYIVFGGLGLLGWLAVINLLAAGSVLTRMSLGVHAPLWLGPLGLYVLVPGTLVLGVVGGVMMLSRQALGWYLVFLSELIDLALTVLSLQIVSILLTAALVYLLFQIREHFR